MGQAQKVSAAGVDLGLWPRDVTSDRSTAHHGRGGTVGEGGYCAARTEISKHTNVGRNEITVVLTGWYRGRSHNQPFLFKDKIGCRLTTASNAETQLLGLSLIHI